MRTDGYLSFIKPLERLITKKVLQVNPTIAPLREEPEKTVIYVFEYDSLEMDFKQLNTIEETFKYLQSTKNVWINLDGLKKADIDKICDHFGIHPLIAEDILSSGQRPKMDELNHLIFCLLNMLYLNKDISSVESEQISIVLGNNFVLSFQEDATRDVFDHLRQKITVKGSKVRDAKPDYLFYALIDLIVDNYFVVMEKLGEKIEDLEEDIVHRADTRTLAKINFLRKELIF